MNRHTKSLLHLTWRLLLVISLLLPASLAADVEEAQAGFGDFIPFVKLISGMMKRNRVYREANSFIKDQAEYYDALRETARQQLLDRKIYDIPLRNSQAAAYTKLVAMIERERDSMYDFAEGEKKAARTEFIDIVKEEVTDRMLASTPATRVLGAMTQGINSSQGFLDSALDNLAGDGGGFLEDVAKVRRIADRMTIAGQVIGGDVGKSIRSAGAKVVELIDKPTSEIEQGLIQVQEELGALGDLVSGLQGRGYRPTASQTTRDVIISLVTGEDSESAVVNQLVDMLVAKHGGGGSIRDRARAIQQGDLAARCAARVEQIRQIRFRMEVDPAGEEEDPPGIFPTCQTVDFTDLVEEVAGAEPDSENQETETTDPGAAAGEGEQPTAAAPQPTAEEAPGETAAAPQPTTTATEYIWVLADTRVNINNERTSFAGGVGDPVYFGEPRFEGKSLTYTASVGSFSVHAVDVDHGYTYADTTVTVNFDSPPPQLVPAEEISLSASGGHGGTVNEGGSGLGFSFQYSYLDRSFDPIFTYLPYNPTWEGPSSQDWVWTVPIATSEGSEFELWAGLWNSPPCNVVWTYRAEKNPNWSEAPQQAPASEESSEPTGTEADPVCEAKRQEVAAKVDIARGADTADLALGIVGYMSAALGDIQVNYCEGGSGAAEKGTPIRIGDCIQTGPNGRGKITFNDRDDKFNAEPTTLYISRGSELCIDDFTVHRDDGRPGMIDHIRGAIRILTRGWQPGSSLGVDVSVKAAVTVASDVVLEYDPDLDLLHTYVNEGSVSVTDVGTGQSQQLSAGELLITHGDSIGAVEQMSSAVWKDVVDQQDLALEDSSTLTSSFGISPVVLNLLGIAFLAALGAGGFFFYRKRKKNG